MRSSDNAKFVEKGAGVILLPAQSSPEVSAARPLNYYIMRLIYTVLFAIALTAINLLLADKMMTDKAALGTTPEVVTINAGDMLIGFVAGTAPDIGEEELRRRARALNADLEAAVIELAVEQNLIVLNAGSVLAGTRDITPLVLERLKNSAAFGVLQ